MAFVQTGEKECEAVGRAARAALHRGDLQDAYVLDRLARKIQASLRLANNSRGHRGSYSWKTMTTHLGQRNPLEDE